MDGSHTQRYGSPQVRPYPSNQPASSYQDYTGTGGTAERSSPSFVNQESFASHSISINLDGPIEGPGEESKLSDLRANK